MSSFPREMSVILTFQPNLIFAIKTSVQSKVCWRNQWMCFGKNKMSADQSSPLSVKIVAKAWYLFYAVTGVIIPYSPTLLNVKLLLGFVLCQNNPTLTGSQQSYLMAGGDCWWHLYDLDKSDAIRSQCWQFPDEKPCFEGERERKDCL